MRAFAIFDYSQGIADYGGLQYHGSVLIGVMGNYCLELVSGTVAQLTAIAALPNVYPICQVSGEGFPELDSVITTAARNRINIWLTARGYPNIPVGWTYRQVTIAIAVRFFPNFEFGKHWIIDAP
jgi:hypothetical protein